MKLYRVVIIASLVFQTSVSEGACDFFKRLALGPVVSRQTLPNGGYSETREVINSSGQRVLNTRYYDHQGRLIQGPDGERYYPNKE